MKTGIIILLLCFLALCACEKYRVVEKESGAFVVQERSSHPLALQWYDYTEYSMSSRITYKFTTEQEACNLMEELKERDENCRKEHTVKKVIECE